MPVEANTRIPVTLEAQQWNVVLSALSVAPWRDANPVIVAIRQQCEALFGGEAPAASPRPNGGEASRVAERSDAV